MSSRYRCAGDTIARSIALAMKLPGGRMPVLIRLSLLERYGWKRTRCREFRIKRASKAKSFEEDHKAGELDKAEEILGVVLPADEDAALPLDPGEEAFNEPTLHVTASPPS